MVNAPNALDVVPAIYSKIQRDWLDYRVLRVGNSNWRAEDLNRRVFEPLYVGNLSENPANVPSPPWAICSGVVNPQTNELSLIVIRQQWAGEEHASKQPVYTDASGMPIQAWCSLMVAISETLAKPVSYSDLFGGIPRWTDLDPAATGALNLVRLDYDLNRTITTVARTIESIGFERCAAIASVLLRSPVMLTVDRADGPTTFPPNHERLAALDAIAGLLPFGVRRELTVSTWLVFPRSADAAPVRLSFAASGKPEYRVVRWPLVDGEPEISGQDATGTYFDILQRLKVRQGTEAIVRHLMTQVSPFTFGAPWQMVESLGSLDRPFQVLLAVRSNAGLEPEVVRDVLRQATPTGLQNEELGELVAYLLQWAQPDDLKIALAYKDSVPALWDALRDTALQKYHNSPYDPVPLKPLYRLAEGIGRSSDLLLALIDQTRIAGPNTQDSPEPSAFQLLLELSENMERKVGCSVARDLARDYPNTISFLTAATAGGKAVLGSWLRFICECEPQVLSKVMPFRIASRQSDVTATSNMIRPLASVCPKAIPALVRVAYEDAHSLENLLPGLCGWFLADVVPSDRDNVLAWRESLSRVSRSGSASSWSVVCQARYDLFALLLDPVSPKLFLYNEQTLAGRNATAYADEILHQVDGFAVESRGRNAQQYLPSLVAHAIAGLNCREAGQAEWAVSLLTSMWNNYGLDGDAVRKASGWMAQMLISFPSLATEARTRLLPQGELIMRRTKLQVALRPDARPEEAASQCAMFLQSDTNEIEPVIAALQQCRFVQNAPLWDLFLQRLAAILRVASGSAISRQVERQLVDAALQGRMSVRLKSDYYSYLRDRVWDEVGRLEVAVPALNDYLPQHERDGLEAALRRAGDGLSRKKLFGRR